MKRENKKENLKLIFGILIIPSFLITIYLVGMLFLIFENKQLWGNVWNAIYIGSCYFILPYAHGKKKALVKEAFTIKGIFLTFLWCLVLFGSIMEPYTLLNISPPFSEMLAFSILGIGGLAFLNIFLIYRKNKKYLITTSALALIWLLSLFGLI